MSMRALIQVEDILSNVNCVLIKAKNLTVIKLGICVMSIVSKILCYCVCIYCVVLEVNTIFQ